MLVLSRRPDESIEFYIDGKKVMELAVLGMNGKQVRLGFDADKSVEIVRSELTDQKKEKTKNAAVL